MKYLKQFFMIIVISFLGEILHAVIPLPVPASIYGIIIMFLCLELKIFPLSAVKETGNFLTGLMQAMFIPAAVGLLNAWELIRASWLPYILLIVVTTVAVMGISGRVTQFFIRRGGRGNV